MGLNDICLCAPEKIQRDGSFPRPGQREDWRRRKQERKNEPRREAPKPQPPKRPQGK